QYDYCFCAVDDNECNTGPEQCTEQYHPRRCECPYEADDLINIPKRSCGCVEDDQRDECQKDSIYYFVGTIDDNHILELDYNKFDFEIRNTINFAKITDYEPYKENISASDSSFLSISKEEFEKLKLTKALNQDEIQCNMIYLLRNFYTSLGIIAKVMNNVDIAPSATYMFAAGPRKVTISNVPQEDKKYFSDFEIGYSCYDDNLAFSSYYGLHKFGISDSICFPNTGIPSDITKC
ncbi:MAG: hypothetical protein EZS28_054281, partial [Streblomastix strix]